MASGHESFPTRWALRIEKQILGTVSGYYGVTCGLNVQEYEQDIQKQPQVAAIFIFLTFGKGDAVIFFFPDVKNQLPALFFTFSLPLSKNYGMLFFKLL